MKFIRHVLALALLWSGVAVAQTTPINCTANLAVVPSLCNAFATVNSNFAGITAGSASAIYPSVALVATTNLTLSGVQTIDGTGGTAGQTLVLASAQSTGAQNGPWIMQTGAWTRPVWYPSGGTSQAVQFATTLTRLGLVYQGSVWRLTTAAPITIDTTATAWSVTPLALNSHTVGGTGLPLANIASGTGPYVLGSASTGPPAVLQTMPVGFPVNLNCSFNFVVSGNSSAANTCGYASFNLSGTVPGGAFYNPLSFVINDSMNTIGQISGFQSGPSYTRYNITAGYEGLRNGWYHSTFVTGSPGLGDTSGGQIVNIQAGVKDVGANLNGRDLNYTDAAGQLWVADFGDATTSGATDLGSSITLELDKNTQTGSSLVNSIGLSVNAANNKNVRGALFDAAVSIGGAATVSTATATNTFAIGLGFGRPNGGTGFYTDGCFICSISQIAPQYNAPQANVGLNFQNTIFGTGSIIVPGAGVDPSGDVSGSQLWTAGPIYGKTATLTSLTVTSAGAYWNGNTIPSCNVQAPPNGGTQATCTVATMGLTRAVIPLINGSFPGYISGASGTTATLNVTDAVTGAAIATGQVLDANIETSTTTVTAGSGTTWTLTCASTCNNFASSTFPLTMSTIYLGADSGCLNGDTLQLVGGTGTAATITLQVASSGPLSGHTIGATVLTAGSYTAKVAAPTTTNLSSSCTAQPSFLDVNGNSTFGFGVLTTTVTNAGSGYPAFPLPLVWLANYTSSRTVPAVLTPVIATTNVPVQFPTGAAGVTNASVAAAGVVGEKAFVDCLNSATSTATITIATPGVVTWTPPATFSVTPNVTVWTCPVSFTNAGGALPTGISTATTYWIIGSTYSAGSFQIADTAAHAIAGTNAVATSGTQSGTQTVQLGALYTGTGSAAVVGLTITAGDWDCSGQANFTLTAATGTNGYTASFGTTSTALSSQDQFNSVRFGATALANTASVSSPLLTENASISKTYYTVSNIGGMSAGTAVAGGTASCRRIR